MIFKSKRDGKWLLTLSVPDKYLDGNVHWNTDEVIMEQ